MLLAVSIATIAVGRSFGIKTSGGWLHDAEAERFDAWYGQTEMAAAEEAIEEYVADFDRLEEQLEVVSERCDTLPIHRWVVVEAKGVKPRRMALSDFAPSKRDRVVPIEVYTPDSVANDFDSFIGKLLWGEEVRIAFLGDSFIEGDILTSDLREALQAKFGGRGVGFVHCDIPFATSRRTIKRTASNWSAYSVLKPKNNPESINNHFFVSGYTARGGKGAKVSWQTTTAFNHIDSCSRARILVASHDGGSVEVMLNADSLLRRRFDLVASELPQEIYIEAPVERVDLSVVEGEVDCYGASIEGRGGVVLDNLSMRANSGHAIFGTSALVNRQIDTLWGYDLVVLQYGLNIMEAGRSNYSAYGSKLKQMVAYAKSSFPDAAVLILGVSDRWVKNEETSEYEPIGSVEALLSYQRGAAEAEGVAFWPTADAMALQGGISQFVANGWAAADHTHINFAGGAQVGKALYSAIELYAYDLLASGGARAPYTVERAKPIETHNPLPEVKPVVRGEEERVVTPADSLPSEQESVQESEQESEQESVAEGADAVEAVEAVAEGVAEVVADSAVEAVETTEEATEEAEALVEGVEPHTSHRVESIEAVERVQEVDGIDESEFFETTL